MGLGVKASGEVYTHIRDTVALLRLLQLMVIFLVCFIVWVSSLAGSIR